MNRIRRIENYTRIENYQDNGIHYTKVDYVVAHASFGGGENKLKNPGASEEKSSLLEGLICATFGPWAHN